MSNFQEIAIPSISDEGLGGDVNRTSGDWRKAGEHPDGR
jgi:hypothetical protein